MEWRMMAKNRRINLWLMLVSTLMASACSHRNIKEKGPSRARQVQSAASTDQYVYVLTNKDELFRVDPSLRSFQALTMPEEVRPAVLLAAGSHLYILARELHYSADEGKSWQFSVLPQPGIDFACFDIDRQGQRLIGYRDQLWYTERPEEELRILEDQGAVSCQLFDDSYMVARDGVRELLPIQNDRPAQVLLSGYGLTSVSSDGRSLLLVDHQQHLIYRVQEQLEALSIDLPREVIIDAVAVGERYVFLTEQSLVIFDAGLQRKILQARGDANRILAQGETILLVGREGIYRLLESGERQAWRLP
jgi:hypothetical protein